MSVLILAAHSDDESIGMGGTIAKHTIKGDSVYGKYFTDGIGSRSNLKDEDKIKREKASKKAAEIIGLKWLESSNFPDNSMDSVPLLEIIKEIEKIKSFVKPKLIYTHSPSDLNIDHKIIAQATLTAFRPKSNEIYEEIRLFEVPSATDYGHNSITNTFKPNLYINIKDTWDKKYKALKEYELEMNDFPNSRSLKGIEYLARYRGSQVGLEYAEAFEVIRKIKR